MHHAQNYYANDDAEDLPVTNSAAKSMVFSQPEAQPN